MDWILATVVAGRISSRKPKQTSRLDNPRYQQHRDLSIHIRTAELWHRLRSRICRRTNFQELFKGVIGCIGIIAKLDKISKVAKGMRTQDLEPRGQIPMNFNSKGRLVIETPFLQSALSILILLTGHRENDHSSEIRLRLIRSWFPIPGWNSRLLCNWPHWPIH